MAVLNKRAIITAIEMYGVTAIRLGRTLNPSLDALIKALFITGEQGFVYDPNDLSTMYQDAVGTVPVTSVGQPVGLVLDKSKGLLLGSDLVNNGNFDSDTAWGKGSGWSISGGKARFDGSASFSNLGNIISTPISGKFLKVEFELSDVGISVTQVRILASGVLGATVPVTGSGKYSAIVLGGSAPSIGIQSQNGTGAGYAFSLDNVSVKELFGNHANQTTPASRPILRKNAVTGANYLEFDGSDDFLQTANIDFTGTDKMSLFAGVRKLSDAAIGMLCELSPILNNNNGSFYLATPGNATGKIDFISKGTNSGGATYLNSLVLAPSSFVVSTNASISEDIVKLRLNSSFAASPGIVDQGTGNYGNYPLYIGRRGGTSLPFNGHIYSLIGIGKLTSDSETAAIEKELAKRTGVSLNV